MKILHSSPTITYKDIKNVTKVLKSKHLEEGDFVKLFEDKLKNFVGRKFAISTTNGFSAIHLSLVALGVDENDEIIIPSYTCPALLNPVLIMGAKPVFADIEEDSFNISTKTIKYKITSKTKAIIVPHTFGFPAKIQEIKKLGIPIIEDCAQSIGGKMHGKMMGTFSEISIFSFYATKLITSGDGGMILTDDENIYKKCLDYRYYGHKKNHRYIAYNYHLTNLPAALGASQLDKIEGWIKKRRKFAEVYSFYFKNEEKINIDFVNKEDSVFFRYPIQIEKRDLLKEKLKNKGIYTGYGVLEGLHQLQKINDSKLPNTTKFLNQILSLPLYPSLKEKHIKTIAKHTLNILNQI